MAGAVAMNARYGVNFRYTVRLPSGELRPFAHAETFAAYIKGWRGADFYMVWPDPFTCLIQAAEAPF